MHKISILVVLALALWTARAEAQIDRGTWRFTIDGDILSVGGVELDPPGPGKSSATVIGFGPNQLGNARATQASPTPIGIGVGYALQPKLILGVRTSLGYDVVAPDGEDNNVRYLGLAVMPGITFIPLGGKTKLALDAAPLIQVDRRKTDNVPKDRTLLGGFALGVGALIFVHSRLSADIGFRFEGRFGNRDNDNRDDNDVHVRDLRGLIRLGVSFWR
ncbi:MAG TPA: hypothetical protein VFX59_18310 [Polyangiales bacterium]|nr:hypothetical protein [Polyangiales bacterium]